MRKKAIHTYDKSRNALLAVTSFAAFFTAIRIPPSGTGNVILGILAFTSCLTVASTYVLRKRDAGLLGIFVFLFLSLNAFLGFDLLNSILLLSFVLGIKFLIQ